MKAALSWSRERVTTFVDEWILNHDRERRNLIRIVWKKTTELIVTQYPQVTYFKLTQCSLKD